MSSNLVNWHQVLFVQFWWMQTLLASDIRINHCTAICLQDKCQVTFHLETFFCCSLSPFESQTTNTKDLWQYDGLQTASRLRDRCFQPKSRFYFYLFPMKINANLLTKPTISFSLSQKIERIEFQIEFFQILVKLWNCTHVNHRILFQIGFFFSRDDLKIILVKIKLHSRSWNTRRRVLLRTVFHYSQLCQYKSNVNVNLIISFIKNSKLVML